MEAQRIWCNFGQVGGKIETQGLEGGWGQRRQCLAPGSKLSLGDLSFYQSVAESFSSDICHSVILGNRNSRSGQLKWPNYYIVGNQNGFTLPEKSHASHVNDLPFDLNLNHEFREQPFIELVRSVILCVNNSMVWKRKQRSLLLSKDAK